ncbi:hydrogenase expression/formation protein HypE [Aestuariibacter salexigens]|uniref:hydrogenase expression/formation protein HypE n=1 Tax=Aestuariibacter salexigens TaxID=226010 RepID=UPI000426D8EC|nr:hydrogenase expression/formation protein HypE [Aestuariibacter salexigens]
MSFKPDDCVTLGHGSGGRAMHELIHEFIVEKFANSQLSELEDQARIPLAQLAEYGSQLAFSTDSYVVDPLFFPGADIGKLAICGTVNDLAVGGATPLFLTCSLIIEEGLSFTVLNDVLDSMRRAALHAGVKIITGDTKVVGRGQCDKLFINTAGIGVIDPSYNLSAGHCKSGDCIIVNGFIGDHGAAVLAARGDVAIQTNVQSDCQALHDLIAEMLKVCPDIRCIRDATRGGVATVLNEFSRASSVVIEIDERSVPIRPEVQAICELLGLDPLYLANEGTLVCVAPQHAAQQLLSTMRKHPKGQHSQIIATVSDANEPIVSMRTVFGSSRIVDMLEGEQLPRIC